MTNVELKKEDGASVLQPPDRYFAIKAGDEAPAWAPTTTWVGNPTTGLTFTFEYEAPDGREYRTVCEAKVDGDGETLTPLKFHRETLRALPTVV